MKATYPGEFLGVVMAQAQEPQVVMSSERVVLREVVGARLKRLVAGKHGNLEDWETGGPTDEALLAAKLLADQVRDGRWRSPFGMYEIVRRNDSRVVGAIGFHGPPQNGEVEIGFDLVPRARGNGYATEALNSLSGWILEHPEVQSVVATTTPENSSAQGVITRAGYFREPDVGTLLVFRR